MEQYPALPQPFDTGWPATTYLYPASFSGSGSGTPSTSALATFLPFLVPRAATITRIGLNLVTAQTGAECRLGLYSDSNGKPGSLIVDAGTLTLASGSGWVEITGLTAAVQPGVIWSCCQLKNVATQATVYRISSAAPFIKGAVGGVANGGPWRYFEQSITYGSALPASAGAVTEKTGSDCPVILIRN